MSVRPKLADRITAVLRKFSKFGRAPATYRIFIDRSDTGRSEIVEVTKEQLEQIRRDGGIRML